jgi:Cu-Zn family superoxide dismutase
MTGRAARARPGLEAGVAAAYRRTFPSTPAQENFMRPLVLAVPLALALAACSSVPVSTGPGGAPAPAPGAPAHRAVAHLTAASGSLVSGTLQLASTARGVRVTGEIGGLAPGSSHGFHVHETGDCNAADASGAGGHFNPTAAPHGRAGSRHHHAGDIDNITAGWDGVAHVDTQLAGVSLGDGGPEDIAGRAFIVHAAADDYRSQPSGNAGARVACGVIRLQ